MEKNIRSIALIGASANKNKYGHIILKDLIGKGYSVFPVHPALKEIDGIPVFNSASELPENPDLFVFVISPSSGLNVTKELIGKGYRKFWYQPGADSSDIIEYLSGQSDVTFSVSKCIMMNTSNAGDLVF